MNLPASAAGQRGLLTGAASDNLPLAEARELGRRDIHLIQKHLAGFLADAAQRGVPDGARLLIDFLEHEVLVAALFRQDGVPQNVLAFAVDGVALEIAEAHAI